MGIIKDILERTIQPVRREQDTQRRFLESLLLKRAGYDIQKGLIRERTEAQRQLLGERELSERRLLEAERKEKQLLEQTKLQKALITEAAKRKFDIEQEKEKQKLTKELLLMKEDIARRERIHKAVLKEEQFEREKVWDMDKFIQEQQLKKDRLKLDQSRHALKVKEHDDSVNQWLYKNIMELNKLQLKETKVKVTTQKIDKAFANKLSWDIHNQFFRTPEAERGTVLDEMNDDLNELILSANQNIDLVIGREESGWFTRGAFRKISLRKDITTLYGFSAGLLTIKANMEDLTNEERKKIDNMILKINRAIENIKNQTHITEIPTTANHLLMAQRDNLVKKLLTDVQEKRLTLENFADYVTKAPNIPASVKSQIQNIQQTPQTTPVRRVLTETINNTLKEDWVAHTSKSGLVTSAEKIVSGFGYGLGKLIQGLDFIFKKTSQIPGGLTKYISRKYFENKFKPTKILPDENLNKKIIQAADKELKQMDDWAEGIHGVRPIESLIGIYTQAIARPAAVLVERLGKLTFDAILPALFSGEYEQSINKGVDIVTRLFNDLAFHYGINLEVLNKTIEGDFAGAEQVRKTRERFRIGKIGGKYSTTDIFDSNSFAGYLTYLGEMAVEMGADVLLFGGTYKAVKNRAASMKNITKVTRELDTLASNLSKKALTDADDMIRRAKNIKELFEKVRQVTAIPRLEMAKKKLIKPSPIPLKIPVELPKILPKKEIRLKLPEARTKMLPIPEGIKITKKGFVAPTPEFAKKQLLAIKDMANVTKMLKDDAIKDIVALRRRILLLKKRLSAFGRQPTEKAKIMELRSTLAKYNKDYVNKLLKLKDAYNIKFDIGKMFNLGLTDFRKEVARGWQILKKEYGLSKKDLDIILGE